MEINPDHPVTRAAHDQWHKICFLLMRKLGVTHVVISLAEIEKACKPPEMAVVLTDKNNTLTLDLVTMKEAERLAKEHGGLPS